MSLSVDATRTHLVLTKVITLDEAARMKGKECDCHKGSM